MLDGAQPGDEPEPGGDGPDRGSRFAAKIRQLARIEVDERQAESLWQSVARHRRLLHNKLGRDVGQRVALLDYMVNLQPAHGELHLIEKTALDSIEHQAVTDSLTALQNRHHFDLELEREFQRARRYALPVALLLFDLDRFKEINDRYGHGVGDAVLRGVGSLILQHVRAADVPCRYGGDEFAIILPDTTLETACGVAYRMSAEITAWFERVPVLGNYVDVTTSGGIASLTTQACAQELLLASDRALYEAKRAGGACISPAMRLVDLRIEASRDK